MLNAEQFDAPILCCKATSVNNTKSEVAPFPHQECAIHGFP